MRYRLRTLLIVLALGPPVLAVGWWGWERYSGWRERQRWQKLIERDRQSWHFGRPVGEFVIPVSGPATHNPSVPNRSQ
jgi:hypothetical protein